ncbi:hypothetical protein M9Y10_023449 [Tritrichomonas musculus]|uniref:Uncharacterized protein n=1 Tax=Tritrichomonas musculus TaxID=1915356 RepID=A0ABR2KX17_9EUKA
MSEKEEVEGEEPQQNDEGNEEEGNQNENEGESQGILDATQEAANNLLGGGGEEEEAKSNHERVKKKRRIRKKVKKPKENANPEEEEEGKEKKSGEEEDESKPNEEEEKKEGENEYTYEYDYEYYYSEDEESKSQKKSKHGKKRRRYPDRPDHLDLSEPIYHLDVPYSANTQGSSPRRNNGNKSFSSTTSPRNENSPRSPKSPREGNKSPRAKKNTNLSQTTSPKKSTRSDDSLPPLNNTTSSSHAPSEEVQQYVKKALNKEPILNLPDETYADILFELTEKRKKYAINHNYKEGDRMADAIKWVENCQKNTQMNAYAEDYKKNFEDEKSKFENDFKNYDAQTQQLYDDLKEKQKAKRDVLLSEQKEEREQHRQKWTSDWMLRQYNKQSVQLTQLRKQHTLLLCQNRFKEAESVNNLINQKAKQEEEANSKRYQFDYDSSVKMLKEKQKSELENFDLQCENAFIKLKGDRQRRRVAFEFREKKINSKAAVANDPEKIWNASMLQRVENTAATSQRRANLPSSRMKKDDLKDLDIMTLNLPPLKLDQEKEEKPKENKGKPKEQDQEQEQENENEAEEK